MSCSQWCLDQKKNSTSLKTLTYCDYWTRSESNRQEAHRNIDVLIDYRFLKIGVSREEMADNAEKLASIWSEIGENLEIEALDELMKVRMGEAE